MLALRLIFIGLFSALTVFAQGTNGWKLVWSDEFNAPAGSPPNPSNWNFDLGGGGWGNNEAQTYTNSSNNVFQDGKGHLVIRAIRDASGAYTSARLQTGSPSASTQTTDLSWQYGLIQARIKIPFGQGVWSAFWMLGENFVSAGWPACGEIDINENFSTYNNNASVANAAAHGPGYSGGASVAQSYTLPFGYKAADDYHLYAIEWSQNSIQWSVDGVVYQKVTPANLPRGAPWVFNSRFFILLNLAIGGPGTFLGSPDPSAPFAPQDMLVDYVRVYQPVTVTPVTPVIHPGLVLNAASYLGTIAPGVIASVFGSAFADSEHLVSVDSDSAFPVSVQGVSVTVDGIAAPLTYVSPTQVNFQVPWETQPSLAVAVAVVRDQAVSDEDVVTVDSVTAPSMFIFEDDTGVVWLTGSDCPLAQCTVAVGGTYTLWGNGFGPKNSSQIDGQPAISTGSLLPLQVPGGPEACGLTVNGQKAIVTYCGAAPGLIIDQLNFEYPQGLPTGLPYLDAALTIDGVTGRFRLPAPSI